MVRLRLKNKRNVPKRVMNAALINSICNKIIRRQNNILFLTQEEDFFFDKFNFFCCLLEFGSSSIVTKKYSSLWKCDSFQFAAMGTRKRVQLFNSERCGINRSATHQMSRRLL